RTTGSRAHASPRQRPDLALPDVDQGSSCFGRTCVSAVGTISDVGSSRCPVANVVVLNGHRGAATRGKDPATGVVHKVVVDRGGKSSGEERIGLNQGLAPEHGVVPHSHTIAVVGIGTAAACLHAAQRISAEVEDIVGDTDV